MLPHSNFQLPYLLPYNGGPYDNNHANNPSDSLYPMDPTGVDFRAFYPYTPNEVKHRKRTTTNQLKILEGVFKRDTKPNAALRNELATQLEMTPRGVQVWFQNRRAKEKTKASKLGSRVDSNGSEPPQSPSPQSSPDESSGNSNGTTPNTPPTDPSSPRASPPQLHLNTDSSANNSWQSSPVATPEDVSFQSSSVFNMNHQPRDSLPADMYSAAEPAIASPPLLGHLDPSTRRCSVDASLTRLASNPYAHLARVKNSPYAAARISGRRIPNRVSYPTRTNTMPQGSQYPPRHQSMDASSFRFPPTSVPVSPSPSPLSFAYSVRASLPDNTLYAFSSRQMADPIPGPLPSPGFSFGAANITSRKDSPEMNGFYDAEDDGSTSYGAYSRFGSIASVGTADSSNTSAYYSDFGSCVDQDLGSVDAHRRDSCTGHFLGLMSNLSGLSGPQDNVMYPQSDNNVPNVAARPPPETSTYASQNCDGLVQDTHDGALSYGHHSDPPNDGFYFYPENTSGSVPASLDFANPENSVQYPNVTANYPRYTDTSTSEGSLPHAQYA